MLMQDLSYLHIASKGMSNTQRLLVTLYASKFLESPAVFDDKESSGIKHLPHFKNLSLREKKL